MLKVTLQVQHRGGAESAVYDALFPIAKGALFMQKKLGFRLEVSRVCIGLMLGLRLVVAAVYRPPVLRMSLIFLFWRPIAADTPIRRCTSIAISVLSC